MLFHLNLCSVQFSCSVVSDSLLHHESQHASPPCPSLTPGVHPNPCPLSRWCHPTISSSVVPFSSHLQSFPALRSFPMNRLFLSNGRSIGASASAPVLPTSIQGWFPLGLTGLISLLLKLENCSEEFCPAKETELTSFSGHCLCAPLRGPRGWPGPWEETSPVWEGQQRSFACVSGLLRALI